MENKHEYFVFVFRRGNGFNGFKLADDGSILCTVESDHDIDWNKREYINTTELTIDQKYGEESNSIPYEFLTSIFTDGDVLKITCTIDENRVFNKKVEKMMDKEFCETTLKSWNQIKHHWFHPQRATERIEEHINELNNIKMNKSEVKLKALELVRTYGHLANTVVNDFISNFKMTDEELKFWEEVKIKMMSLKK